MAKDEPAPTLYLYVLFDAYKSLFFILLVLFCELPRPVLVILPDFPWITLAEKGLFLCDLTAVGFGYTIIYCFKNCGFTVADG